MNWAGKTCVVTGGAGFIGSHLVDELLARGATVLLLDAVETGRNEADNLRILKSDITRKEALKVEGGVDYIFHLAALAYPKLCNDNPHLAFHVNVSGTLNMLLLAAEKGVRKFVFPSSAQLYGRYPKYMPVDERHPIEFADNFYNLTKRFGEDLCTSFYEKDGLPVVFFRLFNSFGPRQGKDYLIPTIISQAIEHSVIELWNDKPTRDFTFVSDTVNAFILAAESSYCGGPINIGSGKEISVGEIARQIADTLKADIRFLNKEVVGSMNMCCDNTKAKQVLGWEPTVMFKDGLHRTIQHFKQAADGHADR